MAKLFDSLRRGVSDASSKAKTIVDANLLKTRASHLLREIESEHQALGAIFYNAVKGGDSTGIDELTKPLIDSISEKLKEIDSIHEKVKVLNGEKGCPACGKTMPLESRFCPDCGQKATDPAGDDDLGSQDDGEAED